jgi:hypothetical protein
MSVSRAASLNQPNYVLRALRAPSIVPSIQLSPAEAAHMSDPRAETAEPDCALKSCPTVEPATVEPATVEPATVEPATVD